MCRTPVKAISGAKNITSLAVGISEDQNLSRNSLNLASEFSRGLHTGQGSRKWTPIYQGKLGGPFGVHYRGP